MFDLGLSRALTKTGSGKTGPAREDEIPALVWTSLFLIAGLLAVGGIVVLFLVPWMVLHPLKIPVSPNLGHPCVLLDWLFHSHRKFVTAGSGRGVLEALQRFRLATAIRIPMGIFT